jgi:hypothetical protein
MPRTYRPAVRAPSPPRADSVALGFRSLRPRRLSAFRRLHRGGAFRGMSRSHLRRKRRGIAQPFVVLGVLTGISPHSSGRT